MFAEIERLVERLVESQFNIARAEGRAEGISEGETKKGISVAKNLLTTTNLPIESIAQCTGLTVEEVTALAEK
jgi:predicted transposase YdaD